MSQNPANPPVMALKRGLDIFEFIASDMSQQGVTLSDIADFMSLKLTTTHNLVKTLEMCGFVRKTKTGSYSLGWKSQSLSRVSVFDLSPQSPVMKALAHAGQIIGHDIAFTSLVNGKRIVLSRIIGSQLIRVDSTVADSEQKSIWQVVTGRVLAAFCDENELQTVIDENGMPQKFWQNIKTEQQLQSHLKKIHSAGYAEDITESIASIALPVLFENGNLAGALGVALPEFQFSEDKKQQIIDTFKKCCQELSNIASSSAVSID